MRSADYCPALKSIIPSTKPNQVLAAMQTSTGSRKIDIFQNISGLIPGQRYQFQFEYIADCSKTTARCQGSVGYNMKTDKNTFSAKMDLQPGNVQTFTRVFFIDSTSMTLEVFAEVTPSVPLCIDNVRIFQSRGFWSFIRRQSFIYFMSILIWLIQIMIIFALLLHIKTHIRNL